MVISRSDGCSPSSLIWGEVWLHNFTLIHLSCRILGMMSLKRIFLLTLMGLVSRISFSAEQIQSTTPFWRSQAKPTCNLIYENPAQGTAVFRHEKLIGLNFYWEPKENVHLAKSVVDIEALPPAWRSDIEPEYLGFSRTLPGTRLIELKAPQTSTLLMALKRGAEIHMKVRLEQELLAQMADQNSSAPVPLLASYKISNSNFIESLEIFDQCAGLGLVGPQDQTIKRPDQIVRAKTYVKEFKGDSKLVPAPPASEAAIKPWKFAPDPKNNKWDLSVGPFACSMTQKILNFGDATFQHKAGTGEIFLLNATEKNQFAEGEAKIETLPHNWRPTQVPLSIGRAESHASTRALSLDSEPLLLLAIQLNLGTQVLISAPSAPTTDSKSLGLSGPKTNLLRVILDSQNFKEQYKKFQQCGKDLIQTTFAQVARTQFNFSENFSELSAADKATLKKIAIYSNADSNILGLFVDAHTDNSGKAEENAEVSRKVAAYVAQLLKENGVNESRITSRAHADKFPIGDNRTLEGRAKNRRVTVRLFDEQARIAAEKAVAERNAREAEKMAIQSSLPSAISKKLQEIHQAESGQSSSQSGDTSSATNSSSGNKKVTAEEIRKLIEGLNAIDGQ